MPVRVLSIIAVVALSSASVRADLSYQITAQATAGTLSDASAKPIIFTRYIKGNRMAEVWKDHTVIVDLDKEIVALVDPLKKTYSVTSFAGMKESAAIPPGGNAEVSAKPTGRTQSVGVLTARETMITIHGSGENGVFTSAAATWQSTVPGYDEARNFERKLGEKLGYAYASGLSPLAMGRGAATQGLGEIAKALCQLDGAPIERTLTIGEGTEIFDPSAYIGPHQSLASAAAVAALSRIGLGHKKPPPPVAAPGLLLAVSVELTNISSAPVEAPKLDVPPGFTLRK